MLPRRESARKPGGRSWFANELFSVRGRTCAHDSNLQHSPYLAEEE